MSNAWTTDAWSWSPEAEQVVSRLLSNLVPTAESDRLSAIPIGVSMWASYFLRPNGEVVVLGEDDDRPEIVTIHTETTHVLRTLVWGSKRYPVLKRLLPIRGPRAID